MDETTGTTRWLIDGRGDQWDETEPNLYRMRGTNWYLARRWIEHHYGIASEGTETSGQDRR
jgi:hypothetical protein